MTTPVGGDAGKDVDAKSPNTRFGLFNELSFGLLDYLAHKIKASELEFQEREGCGHNAIEAWSEKHYPFKLPEDMSSFYLEFDGIDLRWRVSIGDNGLVEIGATSLKRLDDIDGVPLDLEENDDDDFHGNQPVAAFCFEGNSALGRASRCVVSIDEDSSFGFLFSNNEPFVLRLLMSYLLRDLGTDDRSLVGLSSISREARQRQPARNPFFTGNLVPGSRLSLAFRRRHVHCVLPTPRCPSWPRWLAIRLYRHRPRSCRQTMDGSLLSRTPRRR